MEKLEPLNDNCKTDFTATYGQVFNLVILLTIGLGSCGILIPVYIKPKYSSEMKIVLTCKKQYIETRIQNFQVKSYHNPRERQ